MELIERTKREWGVRLVVQPFNTVQHADMAIQADIHRPRKGQRKQVYVTFHGTSGESLRYTDARTWKEAYSAIIAEVDTVVEELAPPRKTRKAKVKVKVKAKVKAKVKKKTKKKVKKKTKK